MPTAIEFENVSKRYRLGQVGTGTLAHDLNRLWARLRGAPDPYANVGAENDRTVVSQNRKGWGTEDYVWALRDITCSVEEGQVLGIVGRNGAGKSTLLKLLSRVTAPTSGMIRAKGRIASLLEVGTGFHPDLTGRENIYLNGAILGMRKQEIRSRLDDIIDFSGCARYVDTPVKRYSSGMMVRLGFAVAAHLECEILVVDEVLAVGDAEFQKACIGRMKSVAKDQGRTILFVSHNMSSVATLCNKAVFLSKGTVTDEGDVRQIISKYINSEGSSEDGKVVFPPDARPGNEKATIHSVELLVDNQPTADIPLDKEITLQVTYETHVPNLDLSASFHVNDKMGGCIFATANIKSAMLNPDDAPPVAAVPGMYRASCKIPANFLNSDSYFVSAFVVADLAAILAEAPNCLTFMAHDTGDMRKEFHGTWIGTIRPRFHWLTEQLQGVPS